MMNTMLGFLSGASVGLAMKARPTTIMVKTLAIACFMFSSFLKIALYGKSVA
jgi:hypothetical protein